MKNLEKFLESLGTERAGDVSLKRVEGKDVYVDIKGAVYKFLDVPEDIMRSFKGMLAKGAGFNALRYLQTNVGKGTKVQESSVSDLTDKILSGEEDIETLL